MKIVFMGTPAFAVPSLDSIIKADYEVVGVVTAHDKPAGRGMHLKQSAVKEFALSKGLKILQPENLKSEIFLEDLRSLEADLQVVIAFRMLPEKVWGMPPLGTINLHASLLPDYRGAAPINWAIINGESKTGVCTFFLKHEIDTGDILLREEVEIGGDTNAGELHDTLMQTGADVMVKSLQMIDKGNYVLVPQGNKSDKVAPKIIKAHCEIDWKKSCSEVHNLIRGLSPYPTAFTEVKGKILKVYQAEKELQPHSHDPGTYITDAKSYLKCACSDGFILMKEVQIESKKKMDVAEFLRGHKSLFEE